MGQTKSKMKRIAFAGICFVLIAWKESSLNTTSGPKQNSQQKQVKQYAKKDIEDGKQLIAKSDCATCHRSDFKLIGPAYKDVAIKYAASATATTYLANKIIKGGSGVWGEIPMTPHTNVSLRDGEKLAKYILSVK